MDTERCWPSFVDAVAVVWVALFGVDIGARYGVIALSPALWLRPDRHLEASVGGGNPPGLADCSSPAVPGYEAVDVDDRVERPVRIREVLRVRAAAILVREAFPRDLHKIVDVT